MPDIGTQQIALAGVGTFSVSMFVFVMVQMLKDFAPRIQDRAAMACLYLIGLVVALIVVGLTDPSWHAGMTWVAVVVTMILAAQIAKGFYADLFKVSVQNVPVPSDAQVPIEAVTVPAPPQPPPQAPDAPAPTREAVSYVR